MPVWSFVKNQCLHCENPACASACPVEALKKTKDGPVVYNFDRCIGCRYCMLACPFFIPKYEWEKPVPKMRAYLEAMDKALYRAVAPEIEAPIVLAALRPLMLRLAGEKTRGAHPYLVTPEHTRRAREILGEAVCRTNLLPGLIGITQLPQVIGE